MASGQGSPGFIRQVLSSIALIMMLGGLLLIPFVAVEIALGIAAIAGVLLLVVKVLMAKN